MGGTVRFGLRLNRSVDFSEPPKTLGKPSSSKPLATPLAPFDVRALGSNTREEGEPAQRRAFLKRSPHSIDPRKERLSPAELGARVGERSVAFLSPRVKLSLLRFAERLADRLFERPRAPLTFASMQAAFQDAGLEEDFDRMVDELPPRIRQLLFDGSMNPSQLLAHHAQVRSKWEHSPLPISFEALKQKLQRSDRIDELERLSKEQVAELQTGTVPAVKAVAMLKDRGLRDVDVVIVGAGMAGLKAAQEMIERGFSVVVLEAKDRLGGRAHTDEVSMSLPLDQGAAWLHYADENPLTPVAQKLGFTVIKDDQPQLAYHEDMDPREAGAKFSEVAEEVYESWTAPGGRGLDIAAGAREPRSAWERAAYTALGPLSFGVEPGQVSTKDFAKIVPESGDRLVKEGLGSVVRTFGYGVPVKLSTPVHKIEWSKERESVTVSAGEGKFRGSMVLVTTSAGVIANEGIEFQPPLPVEKKEAAEGLSMSRFEKIALEFDRDLFKDVPDTTHVRRISEEEEGASFLMRPFGSKMVIGFVGGAFAERLEKEGQEAAVEFALTELEAIYGPEVREAKYRAVVTSWGADPHTMGSYTAAKPGQQHQRKALFEPVDDLLFFAGEGCHERWGQCVPGAYLSAEEAAERMAQVLIEKRRGFAAA